MTQKEKLKFKKIYVEITNICNMSCEFCPKTNRTPKFMNKDEFRYIARKIRPYGEYIYFHIMGEPFLNTNLPEFLAISKEEGLKVNITTNGTLIKKVEKVLLSSSTLRKISISLHSFEANSTEINLEKYIENIIDFVKKASDDSNIICELRLWNRDSEELKASNSLNGNILKIIEKRLRLDFDLQQWINENGSCKLRDRVYLETAEKFQWPEINIDPISERGFCYGLRDQIGILVDGTVVPCCLDSEGNIPLGNIFKEDISDILSSKRAKDIYEGFSKRIAVEDLCKRCGYARRFKK